MTYDGVSDTVRYAAGNQTSWDIVNSWEGLNSLDRLKKNMEGRRMDELPATYSFSGDIVSGLQESEVDTKRTGGPFPSDHHQ